MKFLAVCLSLLVFFFLFGANSPAKDDFTDLRGPYMGQKKPGLTPRIFAPGIVSTSKPEFNAAFSPDGQEFFFSISQSSGRETMLVMKLRNSLWTRPQSPAFVSPQKDCDPFFSQDGNRLYFISTRPKKNKPASRDWDIWFVKKTPSGWSEPENIGPPVNSDQDEYYVSLTKDKTIYFASNRAGGSGLFDIYCSKLRNNQYSKPKNLGTGINTRYLEHDPLIAPDESYIIFTSVNRPDGFGSGDLYISFRTKDNSWGKAKNMGKLFNSKGYDFCPMVSPDGQYFFFTSRRDIYWVSIKAIKKLKPAN
jgi:Tol biopolymer transport system component